MEPEPPKSVPGLVMKMNAQTKAPSCMLIIFGAAGDLTKRLLVPALCHLRRSQLLPEEFAIIGVDRAGDNGATFRRGLGDFLHDQGKTVEQKDWQWLAGRIYHLKGDFDDPNLYPALAARLREKTKSGQGCNYLFYLATPPKFFALIVRNLYTSGLLREESGCWRRVVIEKPLGTDLASVQALNRELLSVLREDQIYRIDHYLGKETVQNVLVFRFSNGFFEPVWNRHYIDHVQITVAESLGVESRGRFYHATGALRDMVPSHLFQLLALTAMEPPSSCSAKALRAEKIKVLEAIHELSPDEVRLDVVRAQFGEGLIAGKPVPSYRKSPEVPPDSTAETYVALKLLVDNWRWSGVPFYLRTGKALAKRETEIAIRFKPAPLRLFRGTPVGESEGNDLVLHIQPEEGVTLSFGAKVPGPEMRRGEVAMRFNYEDYFKTEASTGYETLIYDCMIGDQTLFRRAEEVEAGWRVIQPILDAWAAEGARALPLYEAGSAGPREADELLARDGRRWRRLGAGALPD
jgi:glucose-6-phosphate 1-dehydrogenase